MSKFNPGQAVVIIDTREPTYLMEGVVTAPPKPPVRKDSAYVSLGGNRMWFHDHQLREGRLEDGIRCVYLSVPELFALVQADEAVVEQLPMPLQAAVYARQPVGDDTLLRARKNLASALTLALEAGT